MSHPRGPRRCCGSVTQALKQRSCGQQPSRAFSHRGVARLALPSTCSGDIFEAPHDHSFCGQRCNIVGSESKHDSLQLRRLALSPARSPSVWRRSWWHDAGGFSSQCSTPLQCAFSKPRISLFLPLAPLQATTALCQDGLPAARAGWACYCTGIVAPSLFCGNQVSLTC
jgi:hypothetical protein